MRKALKRFQSVTLCFLFFLLVSLCCQVRQLWGTERSSEAERLQQRVLHLVRHAAGRALLDAALGEALSVSAV